MYRLLTTRLLCLQPDIRNFFKKPGAPKVDDKKPEAAQKALATAKTDKKSPAKATPQKVRARYIPGCQKLLVVFRLISRLNPRNYRFQLLCPECGMGIIPGCSDEVALSTETVAQTVRKETEGYGSGEDKLETKGEQRKPLLCTCVIAFTRNKSAPLAIGPCLSRSSRFLLAVPHKEGDYQGTAEDNKLVLQRYVTFMERVAFSGRRSSIQYAQRMPARPHVHIHTSGPAAEP
eukprot:3180631-Pyramimonas_sp.AAC.1